MVDLSDAQYAAYRDIKRWLCTSQQVYQLGGYAGTGKTTLISHLANENSGRVFVFAPTGKAAHVLQNKGISKAATLHSGIYKPVPRDRVAVKRLNEEIDDYRMQLRTAPPTRAAHLQKQLAEAEKAMRKLLADKIFVRNDESKIRNAALVIVDEASMVGKVVWEDLLSFGVKVLAVGDPAQLPPVKDESKFLTTGTPDWMLTEIHRQALESPIIRVSMAIRAGDKIQPYGDTVQYWPASNRPSKWRERALEECDQIICGFNKTRQSLNAFALRLYEHKGCFPTGAGYEKIIVLENDRELGVFNGQSIILTDVELREGRSLYALVCRDPEWETEAYTPIGKSAVYKGFFEATLSPTENLLFDDKRLGRMQGVHADWGFAITCHKSQGSEWETVAVVDDGFAKAHHSNRDMRKRWLYTAVTRASERVVFIGTHY